MNYHSFHFLAPAITLYAPTSVLEQDRWFHPGFSTCLSLCLNLSLLSYHPPSSSGSLSLWAQSSLNPAQVHPAFLSWSFWTFVSSIFFSTLYIVSYPRVLPFQLNVQLLGNGRPSGVTARQTVGIPVSTTIRRLERLAVGTGHIQLQTPRISHWIRIQG